MKSKDQLLLEQAYEKILENVFGIGLSKPVQAFGKKPTSPAPSQTAAPLPAKQVASSPTAPQTLSGKPLAFVTSVPSALLSKEHAAKIVSELESGGYRVEMKDKGHGFVFYAEDSSVKEIKEIIQSKLSK